MRVLLVAPGLHKYARGAEVTFLSLAEEFAKAGDLVTVIGSGQPRTGMAYRFLRAASVSRENFESFPVMPGLRNECVYEELTFIPSLLARFRPSDYDVTMTCSYPFTNWILRRPAWGKVGRPPHIFVTQNGDWPAYANNSEYRFFGCEGLVCTNPEFYERNKARWHCRIIPNGVDCSRFQPGASQREEFGLPADRLIVLMVSALIPSKRVELGIEAASHIEDAHLVVAGDGPGRGAVDALARSLLPGRFTRLALPPEQMPALYRSADMLLHLAQDEAFGNAFIEAMACGLPIVAGDSARLRWIVGDSEELVFNVSDPNEIAKGIRLSRDAPRARRQTRVDRAAGFSWSRIGQMYREFLTEVITKSKESVACG